jgi:hypothetical protein
MFQPQIWKTHKRREPFENCPHCEKPIRWEYDGSVWIPCDPEPVMFIMHPEGTKTILYKRRIVESCLLYKRGDPRFEGVRPLHGLTRHYSTCPVLIEHRRAYAKMRGER